MGKYDALAEEISAVEISASSAGGKACSLCNESKPQDAYSNKQWTAKAHSRKCNDCIANPPAGGSGGTTVGKGGGNTGGLDSPPPFYDENCDPEFLGEENLSMVFQEEYKPMLLSMEKGEMGADENLVKPEFRHMVTTGMTGLQSAASMADIPMMKAVLRRGARIDRFNGTGSNMQMLIGMMIMQGEMVKGHGVGSNGNRSRLKALEFLLSVGADPNAKPDESLGDILPGGFTDKGMFLSMPPLHLALAIRDSQLAKAVLELLLQHKADHKVMHEGKTCLDAALTPGMKMTLKALIKRYQDQPRPVRLCPCGSALPFDTCHGHKTGVPVHPRALCPCKSDKDLPYGECCLKAGVKFRETIPAPTIPAPCLVQDKK